MLHWCTFTPVLSARRCSVNVALAFLSAWIYALKPENHADWLDAILLRYQVATIHVQFIYSEMPVKRTFYYDLL